MLEWEQYYDDHKDMIDPTLLQTINKALMFRPSSMERLFHRAWLRVLEEDENENA